MSSSSVMSQRLLKKHFWTALIGVFVMSLILIASYSHDKVISHVRSVTRLPAWGKTDDTALSKIIDALYKPSVLSITAQSFTDETGEVFHLTQEPTYTEPLGKRVLILDVDTRPMTDDGQVFSPGGLSWPNPDPMSAGLLSHYLFGESRKECKSLDPSPQFFSSFLYRCRSATRRICSRQPKLTDDDLQLESTATTISL